MNANKKFEGLVSQLNELVETGLVEIKVTRNTSTGYGLGSLEEALKRQVELQTVHVLEEVSEDETEDISYAVCVKSELDTQSFHKVGMVYEVLGKPVINEADHSNTYTTLRNSQGCVEKITNINFDILNDNNLVDYQRSTKEDFLAQKQTLDVDTSSEPIKRIIFTIMGLDREETIQRKIEICKKMIFEIENPDPIVVLRNSDNIIDVMDGFFGVGK